MEYLWAPWRIKYIEKIISNGDGSCIFCDKPAQNKDAENFILYRGELNFVIINRFPYNSGHLMVVPYHHVAALDKLSGEELNEHYKLVARCSSVLKKIMKPDGFNIGMNIGRVAGAGIDKHIHSHVVPRWNGDTNFMPVIAGTKVVNESLEDTYCKLKGEF